MSGHSKWSTIKRQKEVNDKARGQVFSKLAKTIAIAVKTGGGPDPDSNYKLRVVIDTAKQANMPKQNIERAITNATKSAENFDEILYEGFGPAGIGILIEAATDNRNRTSQEVKYILERGEGSLGGPGSVSFNFEPTGLITINKSDIEQEQMLKLIDYGVEDIVDSGDIIEAYVSPSDLLDIKDRLLQAGFKINSSEFIQNPKILVPITESGTAKKIINLLEKLDEHDDIQKIYTNADIHEGLI